MDTNFFLSCETKFYVVSSLSWLLMDDIFMIHVFACRGKISSSVVLGGVFVFYSGNEITTRQYNMHLITMRNKILSTTSGDICIRG